MGHDAEVTGSQEHGQQRPKDMLRSLFFRSIQYTIGAVDGPTSCARWRRREQWLAACVEATQAAAATGQIAPSAALFLEKARRGATARSWIGGANDARHATSLFPSPYYGP